MSENNILQFHKKLGFSQFKNKIKATKKSRAIKKKQKKKKTGETSKLKKEKNRVQIKRMKRRKLGFSESKIRRIEKPSTSILETEKNF
jgi:hypothetical protein